MSLEMAQMSERIKGMIEGMGRAGRVGGNTLSLLFLELGEEAAIGATIPLQNVNARVLSHMVVYWQHRLEQPGETPEWDRKFCEMDHATLFELILAANFLETQPLLDLACRTVAEKIKGKTPEEIRMTYVLSLSPAALLTRPRFGITNDFTPEEERRIRQENEWCEEM